MNSLVSVRTNIYYSKTVKDGVDVYRRHQELVFITDKPKYTYSNEGNVNRERGLEEFRISVTDEGMEQLIELLEKYKEVEPSELS